MNGVMRSLLVVLLALSLGLCTGCAWFSSSGPIEVEYVFSGVSGEEDRNQWIAVRAILAEYAMDGDVREVGGPGFDEIGGVPGGVGAGGDSRRTLRVRLKRVRDIACIDHELSELASEGPAGSRVRLARGVARMRYDGTFVAGRVRFEASGQTAPNATVYLFVDDTGIPTRIPAGSDGYWNRTVSSQVGKRYVYGFSESRLSGAREYFRIDTSRPTNPFDIITEREFARWHEVPPRDGFDD